MCLTVEACCFCINLETGSKTVAVVNLVLATLVAVTYGSTAVTLTYLPPSRRVFYGLVCAAAVCQMALGCLMTYGLIQRKTKFLWLWVRVAWISSVLLVGMAIMGSVVLTMKGTDSSEVSTMASAYLIYGVALYYFTSVVNSRRIEIVREDEDKAALQVIREQNTPKTLLRYEDVV